MIEEHYKKGFKKYKGLAKRYLKCNNYDAEDIANETYSRAWKYKDKFDENIASIDTWINGIFSRVIKDFRRSEYNQTSYVDIDEIPIESKETDLDMSVEYDEICKRISMLVEDKRNICYLYFLKDVPVRDIIKIVGDNRYKVENTIKAFKKKIKEISNENRCV